MKFFTIIKDSSERVPGKNFVDVAGKPLWRHTVDRFCDYPIFIDSDSSRLLDYSRQKISGNVNIYERLAEHVEWEKNSSTNGSPVNAMLARFLTECVTDDQEPIVLFHVTSPFVKLETVLRAVSALGDGYGSVQSVTVLQDFVWSGSESSSRPVNFNPLRVTRTQDLPPFFVSRGAFFILTKKGFQETGVRDIQPRLLFPLSPIEAIDIDSPGDLSLARIVGAGLRDGLNEVD